MHYAGRCRPQVRSKASEVSQLKSEVQALRKDLAESKAVSGVKVLYFKMVVSTGHRDLGYSYME